MSSTSTPHAQRRSGRPAGVPTETTAPPATPEPPKAGLWREEVLDRAGRLEVEIRRLGDDPRAAAAQDHVEHARDLTRHTVSITEWWSGSLIEACWRELRLAEETVFDAGPVQDVLARVKDARTHASFYLGDGDRRTKNLARLLDAHPVPSVDVLVPTARIALAASHEASDRQHREHRAFVNTLRVTICLLVVLGGLLIAGVAAWGGELLPTIGDGTQPELVAAAMLFGALGAMFSAVPSLAQMPTSAQPFNPVRTQAALKVVVGAWSAVVGLMAVSASLVDAGSDTHTLAGFAMVAAIFGAGQEALTRFADHKAAGLSGTDFPSSGTTT